mmetsp:Transcript_62090/g.128626  ORF Transcript_62090/g.128626 Transcript_62090/m.128626 type:complete len:228 (-) Transcript_62090:1120-1803(-)
MDCGLGRKRVENIKPRRLEVGDADERVNRVLDPGGTFEEAGILPHLHLVALEGCSILANEGVDCGAKLNPARRCCHARHVPSQESLVKLLRERHLIGAVIARALHHVSALDTILPSVEGGQRAVLRNCLLDAARGSLPDRAGRRSSVGCVRGAREVRRVERRIFHGGVVEVVRERVIACRPRDVERVESICARRELEVNNPATSIRAGSVEIDIRDLEPSRHHLLRP